MERGKVYSFKEILEVLNALNEDIIIIPNYSKSLPRIRDKEIEVNGMSVKGVSKVVITKTDCDIGNNQKYHNVICKFLDTKNRVVTYQVLSKYSSITYKNGFFGDEFVIK